MADTKKSLTNKEKSILLKLSKSTGIPRDFAQFRIHVNQLLGKSIAEKDPAIAKVFELLRKEYDISTKNSSKKRKKSSEVKEIKNILSHYNLLRIPVDEPSKVTPPKNNLNEKELKEPLTNSVTTELNNQSSVPVRLSKRSTLLLKPDIVNLTEKVSSKLKKKTLPECLPAMNVVHKVKTNKSKKKSKKKVKLAASTNQFNNTLQTDFSDYLPYEPIVGYIKDEKDLEEECMRQMASTRTASVPNISLVADTDLLQLEMPVFKIKTEPGTVSETDEQTNAEPSAQESGALPSTITFNKFSFLNELARRGLLQSEQVEMPDFRVKIEPGTVSETEEQTDTEPSLSARGSGALPSACNINKFSFLNELTRRDLLPLSSSTPLRANFERDINQHLPSVCKSIINSSISNSLPESLSVPTPPIKKAKVDPEMQHIDAQVPSKQKKKKRGKSRPRVPELVSSSDIAASPTTVISRFLSTIYPGCAKLHPKTTEENKLKFIPNSDTTTSFCDANINTDQTESQLLTPSPNDNTSLCSNDSPTFDEQPFLPDASTSISNEFGDVDLRIGYRMLYTKLQQKILYELQPSAAVPEESFASIQENLEENVNSTNLTAIETNEDKLNEHDGSKSTNLINKHCKIIGPVNNSERTCNNPKSSEKYKSTRKVVKTSTTITTYTFPPSTVNKQTGDSRWDVPPPENADATLNTNTLPESKQEQNRSKMRRERKMKNMKLKRELERTLKNK